ELFVILEQVDSTNNYAMQQVHSGKAREGDAWFAIEQTKGKGRRDKHWIAKKGENIILSVIVNTLFLRIYEQFHLSAAASLACYDLFKKYDSINTKIKWPNDLFWNDRKAGGILIQNVIKGDTWQWAVVGMGININQTSFPFFEKNEPISLKQITGENFDPVKLGKELHHNLMNRLNQLKTELFKNMLDEYNTVLYKRKEKVKLKMQNIIFETTITGVSANGQLLTIDSMEHGFNFDEIEWLL
ncbi:MAG: biotin--[acetyl-CoA-carboxylase] ligase, partial [Ginsengibacter sp.]